MKKKQKTLKNTGPHNVPLSKKSPSENSIRRFHPIPRWLVTRPHSGDSKWFQAACSICGCKGGGAGASTARRRERFRRRPVAPAAPAAASRCSWRMAWIAGQRAGGGAGAGGSLGKIGKLAETKHQKHQKTSRNIKIYCIKKDHRISQVKVLWRYEGVHKLNSVQTLQQILCIQVSWGP